MRNQKGTSEIIMNNIEFEREVAELIGRRTEGEYWDFKQQWYLNNTDLLHDIICMANSIANRDCYIIIGIEDETFKILGVDANNRKNQQNVIDLLRQKPKWAGGHIPEVYVRTIQIDDKELDIIIIKQSNNTPFYLLEDYTKEGPPIFKGVIYTRKGDTNTPKTSTADLYDIEILWKRHFGLLYNPSQRAKFYLADLENWKLVDGETNKFGISQFFFFYKPDPDFTIYFLREPDDENNFPKDINDDAIGSLSYYLFAFCNVSYHTDYSSREEVILYYRDVPLFSAPLECVDEGRTSLVPPEFVTDPYYISDSFRYLMFEFVLQHRCGNYSGEAKEMFRRVIPIYKSEQERDEFENYIEQKGFPHYAIGKRKLSGEALKRFEFTEIRIYKAFDDPAAPEQIATELKGNPYLVVCFAHPDNKDLAGIVKALRTGKMLVDWLDEWRKYTIEDNNYQL